MEFKLLIIQRRVKLHESQVDYKILSQNLTVTIVNKGKKKTNNYENYKIITLKSFNIPEFSVSCKINTKYDGSLLLLWFISLIVIRQSF